MFKNFSAIVPSTRHRCILIVLLIIIPLGLFSKQYTGIAQTWVRNYSGDILYEIFWCSIIFWFINPKCSSDRQKITQEARIALWVFIFTCAIEISQLWFDLIPLALRSSVIWKLLLGSAFAWWDFPHYALGSFSGWLCMILIKKIELQN
jgi:hypothetical protein